MRYIFFANTAWYLYNFRRPLIDLVVSKGHEAVLVCPQDRYSDYLADMGYCVRTIEFSRHRIRPIQELVSLYRIIMLFRKVRPHICHSFTLRCVVLACIANKFVNTPKRVYSLTGMGYLFSRKGWVGAFISQCALPVLKLIFLSGSSHIIVQNSTDYRLLRPLTARPSVSLHIILGSGVDTHYLRPTITKKLKEGHSVAVLMATRLLQDKGVNEFIEAARMLGRKNSSVHFLLAGETDPGNPTSVNSEIVAQWKKEGNLSVLGHQVDMLNLYHRCDIVVLPSYREGLPRCLIEAAACGIPAIATNVPGCNEVIEHGKTGFLTPLKDPSSLAIRIEELAASPKLRKKMGLAARKRCVALFDQHRINNQTTAVYDTVISDDKPNSI